MKKMYNFFYKDERKEQCYVTKITYPLELSANQMP